MNKNDLSNDPKRAKEILNGNSGNEIDSSISINQEVTFRHPLMIGQESDYVIKAREELKLDEELGLSNQAIKTAKSVLERDIDDLTNSRDYYQVDRKTIEKLFDIKKFKRMLYIKNRLNHVKGFFVAQVSPISFLSSALLALVSGMYLCSIGTDKGAITNSFAFSSGIAGIVLSISFFICSLASFLTNKGSYTYETADVDLKIESISSTDIKIPYGAKLKTLEAKESGIFDDFMIITPQFTLNNKMVQTRKNLDPAIVGLTKDNRMFMICYWDIKNDKEKVMKDIEKYKKFKIR
jgi:hypothetical protein